jgi:hypothetical protein
MIFLMCRKLAILLLVLPGCTTTSSDDVATNEIDAHFFATVDTHPGEQQSSASAALKNGLLNFVVLASGDELTAKFDQDAALGMTINGDNSYEVHLPNVTNKSELTIALTRSAATSAPSSHVTLPTAMNVTSPVAPVTVSYATGSIDFAWSNVIAGAQVRFLAEACGDIVYSTDVPWGADTGAHTVSGSALSVQPPAAGGDCVTIVMARRVTGAVDPAFKADESSIEANHYDYLDVTLTP